MLPKESVNIWIQSIMEHYGVVKFLAKLKLTYDNMIEDYGAPGMHSYLSVMH